MILDAFLKMSDALTVGSSTASVVSTSYIDTLAKGDDYAGCFLLSHAVTAVLSGTASATVEFRLAHSDSTAATSFVTLISSGLVDDALVIANYQSKLRIPPGTLRYLRGEVRTSQVTTSGTVTQYIVKDVDVNAQMLA